MQPRKQLVIVDPALASPEADAYNLLSGMVADFAHRSEHAFDSIRVVLPKLSGQRLSEALRGCRPGAVVSLGSFANLTDAHDWIPSLARDLEDEVLARRVPLFGICFTHQLVAHRAGGRVDFLAERMRLLNGAHKDFRSAAIVHPKLRLLTARMREGDYFSGNGIDLRYRECSEATRAWGRAEWERYLNAPLATHTALERRLWTFFEEHTDAFFVAHARHEQEVHALPRGAPWLRAARSPECALDAFVHESAPAFTFQSHPETWHEKEDGWRMLKNFIYLATFEGQGD